jgi:hypothetical protein
MFISVPVVRADSSQFSAGTRAPAATQPSPALPTATTPQTGYPGLAYPGAGIASTPTLIAPLTPENPAAYVASTAVADNNPNPYLLKFWSIVLWTLAISMALAVLWLLWLIARKIVPPLVQWVAAALRTRSGRIVASALLIAGAGFAAYEAAFAPVWPLAAGSATAQTLWNVYLGARAAQDSVICQGEPVTVFAAYYADTLYYRNLSSMEQEWIIKSFGPAALKGAGQLRTLQANYIVVFGALPAASVANPLGLPQRFVQFGPCQAGSGGANASPLGFWTNSASDLAVVRYVAPFFCDGQFDLILRKLEGHWKIVNERVRRHCTGLG